MKTNTATVSALSSLLLMSSLATPQTVEAHPPRARELCGVVQALDPEMRTVTIQSPKRNQLAMFAIKSDTRFIKDRRFTNLSALKVGLHACVYYRSPFFGKPFVTKIVWRNTRQPG